MKIGILVVTGGLFLSTLGTDQVGLNSTKASGIDPEKENVKYLTSQFENFKKERSTQYLYGGKKVSELVLFKEFVKSERLRRSMETHFSGL